VIQRETFEFAYLKHTVFFFWCLDHIALYIFIYNYEFIILKLRINLCCILVMPRKSPNRATTIVDSTDNNIGDVDDHAINLGASHIEAPNAHNSN